MDRSMESDENDPLQSNSDRSSADLHRVPHGRKVQSSGCSSPSEYLRSRARFVCLLVLRRSGILLHTSVLASEATVSARTQEAPRMDGPFCVGCDVLPSGGAHSEQYDSSDHWYSSDEESPGDGCPVVSFGDREYGARSLWVSFAVFPQLGVSRLSSRQVS